MSRCAGFIFLLSAAAFAQQTKPSIVLAPMKFAPDAEFKKLEGRRKAVREMPEALGDRLAKDFFYQLERLPGITVPSKTVTNFHISNATRRDWEEADEALAKLAKAAVTRYGMYVYVSFGTDPDGGGTQGLQLLARVVSDIGRSMKTVKVFGPKKKASMRDLFKAQMARLFERLELEKLPIAIEDPSVTSPMPAEELAPIPVVPAQASDGVGGPPHPPPHPPLVEAKRVEWSPVLKPVGYVAAGVGVVAVAVGAVLVAAAPPLRTDSSGNVYQEDWEIYGSSRAQRAAGIGLIAGGAVLGLAGGALALLANNREQAPTSSFVPVSGGGLFVLGGHF